MSFSGYALKIANNPVATIKLTNDNGTLRIILKDGKVACSCCGCAYDFILGDALRASYENIDPKGNWPEDLQIEEFQDIGTFEEEEEYSGDLPDLSGLNVVLLGTQRDNRKYGTRGNGGNGSCARFVCANISYNADADTFVLSTHPIPADGGTASQSSSERDLKELLLQYVPTSFWEQTRNVLFKIHFYGWEYIYQRVGGSLPPSSPLYQWLAPSDTKFKIQYAEFSKITQ